MKPCAVEACGVLVDDEAQVFCPEHRKDVAHSTTSRRAGQGAREIADALARQHPFQRLLAKLTRGFFRSPDYSWRVGADSEEQVGRELLKLPKGWVVRHDIMIGENWNADHVVVGPPGAFVLDTKFRSGVVKTSRRGIRVNGRRTNMAEKVQDQAREISGRLRAAGMKSWVQPALVIDAELRGEREPDGVHVVGLSTVVEYLTSMPRELEDAEVQRLGRILLDDATWPFVRPSVAAQIAEASEPRQRPLLIAAVVVLLLALAGAVVSSIIPARAQRKEKPTREAASTATQKPTGERSPAVEAIRARYQAVGATQRTLRKVTKAVSGMSAEGSTLVGYFDGETLKKAEWTFNGESGQRVSEMTFHEGRLEFLFEKTQREGAGAASQGEKRFYLVSGTVEWATQGKDRVPMSAADIAATRGTVVDLGTYVIQALRVESDKLVFNEGKFAAAEN